MFNTWFTPPQDPEPDTSQTPESASSPSPSDAPSHPSGDADSPQLDPNAPPQDPPVDPGNQAPQYVTQEQFDGFMGTMTDFVEQMKTAQAPQQVAPEPPPPPERTITQDHLNQLSRTALESQDPRDWQTFHAAQTTYNEETVNQRLHTFEQQKFQPIVNQGMQTMAVAAQQSISALPHYKRFEKDIVQTVNQLAPQNSGNPQTWQAAYNLVVGQHADTLIQEATQATHRRAANDPGGTPPPAGKNTDEPATLTIKAAYGDEGYRDLQTIARNLGGSPEQVVQRQYATSRFKGSFQDYLKAQKKAREEQYA